MATAKALNDAHTNYTQNNTEDNLKVLLEIVKEHTQSKLYKYSEAEDLAQDVTIKVWRSIGQLDGRASFSTWLSTVVKNTLLTYLRDAEQYELIGTSKDLALYIEKC